MLQIIIVRNQQIISLIYVYATLRAINVNTHSFDKIVCMCEFREGMWGGGDIRDSARSYGIYYDNTH